MFRNITPVVQNLLLINIAVYLVASFVLPVLNDWFALYYIQSPYFKPFQFLTYMFMHADFWHLFSNMFGLLIFGPLLEQFLGPKKLFSKYTGWKTYTEESLYTSKITQKLPLYRDRFRVLFCYTTIKCHAEDTP